MEDFQMTPLEYKRKQLYDQHMQLKTIDVMCNIMLDWQKKAKEKVHLLEEEVEKMESGLIPAV